MSELPESIDTNTVAIIRRTNTHLIIPGDVLLPVDMWVPGKETREATARRMAGDASRVDYLLSRVEGAPGSTFLVKVPLESIKETDTPVKPDSAEAVIEKYPMPTTIRQLFLSAARLI